MSDWYDEGLSKLKEELTNIVVDNNEPEQIASAIYGFLNEIGLIDYDNEKEILWERYNNE